MGKIPLSLPLIGEEEKKAVLEVLDSGWLAHGEYNHKLEDAFKEMLRVQYALTVNSATSGLELILKTNGITGEVIVPSFTFVASANSIVTAGAIPVFCDVDVETRNVTAEHIKPLITEKTQAVMIVHFGGQPCQMDEIVSLCQEHNLLLVEDSAETLGATWAGRQAGSFGYGCFSFFPTKNMTTGEGGMVTCNDEQAAFKMKALLGHGITKSTMDRESDIKPWHRSASMAGHNYRMSNVLAAIGYHQFLRLPETNKKRQELAARYDAELQSLGQDVLIPKVLEKATHVYQMYTIQVSPEHRDPLVMFLREKGISASVHFDPPVHQQEFYVKAGFPRAESLGNTEELAKTLITLPMYPGMSSADVDRVTVCIKEYFQKREL